MWAFFVLDQIYQYNSDKHPQMLIHLSTGIIFNRPAVYTIQGCSIHINICTPLYWKNGGASRCRVCYQRGIPRLVYWKLKALAVCWCCLNFGFSTSCVWYLAWATNKKTILFLIIPQWSCCSCDKIGIFIVI